MIWRSGFCVEDEDPVRRRGIRGIGRCRKYDLSDMNKT